MRKRVSYAVIVVLAVLLLQGVRLVVVRAEDYVNAQPDTRLCQTCHSPVQVVATHITIPNGEGQCLECHSPHASGVVPGRGTPGLRTPNQKRCTDCHFEYAEKALREKQKQGHQVHSPVMKQECENCHAPHDLGQRSRFKDGGAAESCARCHEKVAKQHEASNQHQPFKDQHCSDCHNSHVSKEIRLLRMPPGELCASCHRSVVEAYNLPVQHKPFNKGLCIDCHSGHASNFKNVTKVSTKDLCQSCHFPELNPLQHKPYKDGACTDCHSPHGSGVKRLLKADSNLDLCARCHAGEVAKVKLPSHHPVGEKLECSSCHRPHTAQAQSLLPSQGKKFCVSCHPNQAQDYEKIGHARMTAPGSADKGACTNCHLPHGSQNSPLLKQNGLGLCRECHQPMSEFEHPMGPRTLAPTTGKPVVCSSCHNPHGTPHKKSTRLGNDGLCLTCHDK